MRNPHDYHNEAELTERMAMVLYAPAISEPDKALEELEFVAIEELHSCGQEVTHKAMYRLINEAI